ncbi:MAG: hypothetical protein HY658_04985 [Actinobacteria bacterium]|nr:hypothetical protein [Actinomycetota bacterium]
MVPSFSLPLLDVPGLWAALGGALGVAVVLGALLGLLDGRSHPTRRPETGVTETEGRRLAA